MGVAGAAWLAEQVGLAEPPFDPEQVQYVVLPADGNVPLLDEPLLHCVYGLYEEEPLGYVYPFAEPQIPATAFETHETFVGPVHVPLLQVYCSEPV